MYYLHSSQVNFVTSTAGPPFDHTTFSKDGHYLFINSTLHNVDEKAHLVTQPLLGEATASKACKISMWYHMYGTGVGSLTVYMQ
jgi:hypothetical protein